MKVLIAHELFPPDFAGGGEYIVLETARHLMRRGIEVHVLTTGDPAITDYEGIPTTRLPIHRYRMNLATAEVAAHARDADVIFTATYHASLPAFRAGRQLNKPVVCLMLGLFGDVWREMRPPLVGRVYAAVEKFLVRLPYDRTIFISDYSREMGLSMGISGERSLVICPGIELDQYAPAAVKDDVVFVTGKLDPRKGIFEVLEAARQLADVRFQIMGWGPLEAQVRAEAPGNVEFLDFEMGKPGKALRDAFATARIFLFPTKCETFGLALIEAMASGCAIVSSVPLPFEGVRVDSNDQKALTEGVRRLWRDPDGCRTMGLRNYELAQQYSWPRYTDRLLACFDDALSERSGTAYDVLRRQA